jgi:MoaA/NifB/PqqE/SkfB family radical SAM enzyme
MSSPATEPATGRRLNFDGRVPAPSFVSVETTMYCNLQCSMCIQFQDGTTVSGPHMELPLFEQVAAAVFPYARRFQPSVSGEPLMSKGLDRMLQRAAEYGVLVDYYTNATLLNDRLVELILPTLGKATISFDGARKTTFEAIRAGADFGRVVTNVKRLLQARQRLPVERWPIIGLACVLMERNVRELGELVELAHELGVDWHGTSHVFPATEEMKQQSLARYVELAIEGAEAPFFVWCNSKSFCEPFKTLPNNFIKLNKYR